MDKFTIVKKGYDIKEVDNKIEFLENIIKSYKDKDNSIKNAIVNAQIAADNIIKNAEMQSDVLNKQAFEQLDIFLNSISEQKNTLNNFQVDYNLLLKKYITNINENEFVILNNRINDFQIFIEKLKNTGKSLDFNYIENNSSEENNIIEKNEVENITNEFSSKIIEENNDNINIAQTSNDFDVNKYKNNDRRKPR